MEGTITMLDVLGSPITKEGESDGKTEVAGGN